jgi:serine/threonine protein kinase
MPKVPGASWSSVADALRSGEVQLTLRQRLTTALRLVRCVVRLERAGCSHRDLSGYNIYISSGSRVFLIDWDCLYHPKLPFQPNTTAGTMGYMAPFLRNFCGSWDASRSWCLYADRFALAVLIVEILLISPETAAPREDGTLFSQSELNEPDNASVAGRVQQLRRLSRQAAILFQKTLTAPSFDTSPPPEHWQRVLRHALRMEAIRTGPGGAPASLMRRVLCECAACGNAAWVDEARDHELRTRRKPVLCNSCLQARLEDQSSERALRDHTYPEINCEHCLRFFRLPRPRLDRLRSKGKPILCGMCLRRQMRVWGDEQREHNRNYRNAYCTQCYRIFRLAREKLETLLAKGISVLCWECLAAKRSAREKQRLPKAEMPPAPPWSRRKPPSPRSLPREE